MPISVRLFCYADKGNIIITATISDNIYPCSLIQLAPDCQPIVLKLNFLIICHIILSIILSITFVIMKGNDEFVKKETEIRKTIGGIWHEF